MAALNTAGSRQLTDRVNSYHGADILSGDERVSRGRSLGYLLSVQHLHRQRQNFIAVTVDAIRHRTQLLGLSPLGGQQGLRFIWLRSYEGI